MTDRSEQAAYRKARWGRFERACLKLGPRAHRWGFSVWVFSSWVLHPVEYVRTMREWKVEK